MAHRDTGAAPPEPRELQPLPRAARRPPYHVPMATIGYAASMEQFHPNDLLDWCEQAEGAGFLAGFMVSEHFHPWTPQQGQSGFAWSFMGALGLRTKLRFGTAVTDRKSVV